MSTPTATPGTSCSVASSVSRCCRSFVLIFVLFSCAPAQAAPGSLTGEFAVAYDDPAVDDDMTCAGRVGVRVLVRRPVDDGLRIEDGDVGEPARLEPAAVDEPEVVRGETGEPSHRLRQRDEALVAAVVAEKPGEGAVRARMRGAVAERRDRRVCLGVGAERHPRLR